MTLAGVMQIADSSFPTGGQAESSGVESLVQLGYLTNQGSLRDVLGAHRKLSVEHCEVWFARRAHSAVTAGTFAELPALADCEVAAKPALLQRRASLRIGATLLDRACSVFGHEGEAATLAAIRNSLVEVRSVATVSGAVVAALGGTSEDAAYLVTYTTLSPMATAAVRLGAVSALDASAALRSVLAEEFEPDLHRTHPATASLLLDVAAMLHEEILTPSFSS